MGTPIRGQYRMAPACGPDESTWLTAPICQYVTKLTPGALIILVADSVTLTPLNKQAARLKRYAALIDLSGGKRDFLHGVVGESG